MESLRRFPQRCRGNHAAHARNGRSLWRAQPLPRGRKHPWRGGLPRLAEPEIQWRSSPDDGGLLRRRVPDLFAGTGVFLAGRPGIHQAGGTEIPRPARVTGQERIGATKAKVEVNRMKKALFLCWLPLLALAATAR